ncbi:hypothetical protein SAMCFNEI73_Ch2720 [Sinorhizobium americanum]|uniref:Uncharacterized protein n=1 Tax=Sinorhizobium americanum TaxID=194963 RepID=A0A1L3LPM8_9HYPH|nr:hypothetical protein SAMCCGM7_Ch2598 [Sinorhizobium americanum CCGM7]APG91996.1 hypothetical protein SAMCFNEI73_Ch2720 [Sinorhizobium americanum]
MPLLGTQQMPPFLERQPSKDFNTTVKRMSNENKPQLRRPVQKGSKLCVADRKTQLSPLRFCA